MVDEGKPEVGSRDKGKESNPDGNVNTDLACLSYYN